MSEKVPNFDTEKIAGLFAELYGLEGEISFFSSFQDQNALIRGSQGSFVLKVHNTRWSREGLEAQVKVLQYLKEKAPEVICPAVIGNKNGEVFTKVEGFDIYLLSFLEGKMLGEVARTPELNRATGRFMGHFSKAMPNFSGTVPPRTGDLWNLDNVLACREYLDDVIDEDLRNCVAGFFERYEKNILPQIKDLRKAVIHADGNEQNILVDETRPGEIVGIIDFGEMQYASQVNELAITLAYALLGQEDFAAAAEEITAGYTEVFPLEEKELEILPDLFPMRLVQNIVMTSHSAKEYPENKHITLSQKAAGVLLRKLESQ
jgi:Ser/Thr protein kinase RdoA (MazF antagonist)